MAVAEEVEKSVLDKIVDDIGLGVKGSSERENLTCVVVYNAPEGESNYVCNKLREKLPFIREIISCPKFEKRTNAYYVDLSWFLSKTQEAPETS